MAAIAKLKLDNEEFTVLDIDYEMYQEVDSNHRISATVRGGIINLVIESSENEDIHMWAASNDMVKSGEVVFKKAGYHQRHAKAYV